jgi:D-alanine-D-alanine ligase
MTSKKIRVAVLFGGRSAEHEVSLNSAKNVIQNLDPHLFEVVPIGIDRAGHWLLGDQVFEKSLTHSQVPQLSDSGEAWFSPEWVGKQVMPRSAVNMAMLAPHNGPHFDVVFPVVHGMLCEDGTLQGLLEHANVPYVGCGVLSSALGMDKDVSKRLALQAGIPSAPYIAMKHASWLQSRSHYVDCVEKELGYPVFVKPANTGSSIGVTKVKSPDALVQAVEGAFEFDTKVVIEKAIRAMELELAVLESLRPEEGPIVSVVGEIKPQHGHEFYSYTAKYLDENGAALIIPALLSSELVAEAQMMAKRLFALLECEGMARVDLFLDQDTNRILFNEVNTIPGFTQISMYPKLMEASGVSYSNLLTHLVQLAIRRHERKRHLIRAGIEVK